MGEGEGVGVLDGVGVPVPVTEAEGRAVGVVIKIEGTAVRVGRSDAVAAAEEVGVPVARPLGCAELEAEAEPLAVVVPEGCTGVPVASATLPVARGEVPCVNVAGGVAEAQDDEVRVARGEAEAEGEAEADCVADTEREGERDAAGLRVPPLVPLTLTLARALREDSGEPLGVGVASGEREKIALREDVVVASDEDVEEGERVMERAALALPVPEGVPVRVEVFVAKGS